MEELSNYSDEEVKAILDDGGRIVCFTYAVSLIVMTFRRPSKIFLLRKGESAIKYGYPYLLISLLLGWWGFPWGPIYTIQSIYYAFAGKDFTQTFLED